MKEELPERYFFGKNKVMRIGQILKDAFPKKYNDRTYQSIKNAWGNIVGNEVCQITKITGFKNGVLYVIVESSVMIHHLTNFEKNAIIDRINTILKTRYIEDIHFKVGILNDVGKK
ncbi:MAG: DUF721 domain-containing protein [Candidatus Jettenia sp.]|uniref:DUF721 domain-containing protein n=1 Tax=Candidatus Jettenia caeni TaxID=247490 RepID=I3IIM9_9BACT|nr:DUF721 domain-containing protein [Candidatus Jettenia sp. AMX1]KAA0243553.1 MAG: DUF721 domain-containing protein [Candidatus Brocadia sp. AMX2]MBC6930236.1 DUF721 domain-containing protein [Candidatus Jettenia sp.]WKZ16890.1 MAG: DUF721 domain-containing protein [Candidatus Jettenia caeni]MCQ3927109.1 DUF721 domain-containing protein [Candidatus Jettenia sp.]MDL1939867.1 DUF721 domain-containing protein [Candidatus Jettenia sp. AMX1]